MGGETSKEETELADDEVEAAVDVTPVGSTEGAPGETDGDLAARSDPGSTHEIEGDGHGAARGNIDNISELEGVSCNTAAAEANTSFDESRDAVNTEIDNQLNVVDPGQKQHDDVVTEPSLSGALRQSLAVGSGIGLPANTETGDEENKICSDNNRASGEMENNSNGMETNGFPAGRTTVHECDEQSSVTETSELMEGTKQNF